MHRLVSYFTAAVTILSPSLANAACYVPHSLANGQVADASKVMDNFDAVAECVDDAANAAVTPSGTPVTGQVTVFSGSKSITGGNLTGDVSTSGGTVTALSATGVTPGTYSSATIAVDAKGRITAAANGTGSAGQPWLVLIADQVADGTSGTLTFTSIPQLYRDLIVVINGQSVNSVQELIVYANGDTNNGNYRNFTWNRFGNGTVAAPRIGTFPGLNIPSPGTSAQFEATFIGYSSTAWKKNALSNAQYEDTPNYFRNIFEWKWNNTAAITQLTFTIPSGNIANGTTFSLYGRGQN